MNYQEMLEAGLDQKFTTGRKISPPDPKPKFNIGQTVIYQDSPYQIVDSYLGNSGYQYDLGTPANRSISENELSPVLDPLTEADFLDSDFILQD